MSNNSEQIVSIIDSKADELQAMIDNITGQNEEEVAEFKGFMSIIINSIQNAAAESSHKK